MLSLINSVPIFPPRVSIHMFLKTSFSLLVQEEPVPPRPLLLPPAKLTPRLTFHMTLQGIGMQQHWNPSHSMHFVFSPPSLTIEETVLEALEVAGIFSPCLSLSLSLSLCVCICVFVCFSPLFSRLSLRGGATPGGRGEIGWLGGGAKKLSSSYVLSLCVRGLCQSFPSYTGVV